MNNLAELYATILLPPADIANPSASPPGMPADAVAVFETIFITCIRGRSGSSPCIDCQLYRTRSLLLGTNVVGVRIRDPREDRIEFRLEGGVEGGPASGLVAKGRTYEPLGSECDQPSVAERGERGLLYTSSLVVIARPIWLALSSGPNSEMSSRE